MFKRKWKKFAGFKERVLELWEKFNRENERRRWKRSPFSFYEDNLSDLYSVFMGDFFGLDIRRLVFVQKSQVVTDEVLFEFEYYFSEEELADIREYRQLSGLLETNKQIAVFIFYYVSITFGKILHDIIQADHYFSQVCGLLKSPKSKPQLDFLLSVREPRHRLKFQYCLSTLYHYLLPVKGIPEDVVEVLRSAKDEIYEIADSKYPKASKMMAGVLNNFYNRCVVLNQVTPVLDLVNFLCARVEDSIFDTQELLVRGFLPKFSFSPEKKRAFAEIFSFINRAATLSATFQSNNKASLRHQFQLFIIICQYYFQGENLTNPEKSPLYFPRVFQRKLEGLIEGGKLSLEAFPIFEQFTLSAFAISRNKSIDVFFKVVFGMDLESTIENFFSSFRRSLNERTIDLVAEKDIELKRQGVDDYLSFKQVMDLICRFLYFLVKTVFMTENSAERSSQNFRDRFTRYRPQGIKLRVLEMELFRELPLSDNVWGDFLRSVYRKEVVALLEPHYKFMEDEFFSPQRLVHLDMIYSQGTITDAPLVAEWLLTDVLVPFATFAEEVIPQGSLDPERMFAYLVNHPATPDDESTRADLKDIVDTIEEFLE
ncbi:MAG: hypothetical protein ACTSU5_10755 [Promethearchaeota archaeon]